MKRISVILVFAAVFIHSSYAQDKWHSGLFRVNTTVSSGDEDISLVAKKASRAGLSFVVLSDQFLVQATYGIPPFRNAISYSKYQKSVVSYGIEKYLAHIEEVSKSNPDLVIVPGADVAPQYYWTGNPLQGTLCSQQFSEQLTVFGPTEPAFYHGLPVIHNDQVETSPLRTALRFLPLLLCILGVLMIVSRRDRTIKPKSAIAWLLEDWPRKAVGLLVIISGLLWIINNRPFTRNMGFDQYTDAGIKPYQGLIDYVRQHKKPLEAGIIWSAPEAIMQMKIGSVALYSGAYLDDILATKKHNGLAGIYGDVSTAHEPGKAWDQLLLEYCSGKRAFRPVTIGESDYHGRKDIDYILTFIHIPTLDKPNVMDALIRGKSYAVAKGRNGPMTLTKCRLSAGGSAASLGEVLSLPSSEAPELELTCELPVKAAEEAFSLTVVLNGKVIDKKTIKGTSLDYTGALPNTNLNAKLNYLRFYVQTRKSGWLLANPIFLLSEKSSK